MDDINPNDRYLQPLEVINFFVNETGPEKRATNKHLVSHFRPLLHKGSSIFGAENHAFLKKVTNQLAVVRKIKGDKYLDLRPEFKDKDPHTIYTCLSVQEESENENNISRPDDQSVSGQKRCAVVSEESNQKYQCVENDAKVSENYKDIEKNNARSSKNVRFTEDTARSRAPISFDLLSELNEWLGDDNKIEDVETLPETTSMPMTPTPPLPPHASDSPPPLPPKLIQRKDMNEVSETTKDERMSSTGFNVEQFQFNDIEDVGDMVEMNPLKMEDVAGTNVNLVSNNESTDTIETPPPLPPKPIKNSLQKENNNETNGETKKSDALMNQNMTMSEEGIDEVNENDKNKSNAIDTNVTAQRTITSHKMEKLEEEEADDSVFPLPDIGAPSLNAKPKRSLSRDTAKTSSVKDLTRNFNQIVSDQAEQNKKISSNRDANRAKRWGPNASGSDYMARQQSRISTTSEDFYSYRPLEDKGKLWILAGNWCIIKIINIQTL